MKNLLAWHFFVLFSFSLFNKRPDSPVRLGSHPKAFVFKQAPRVLNRLLSFYKNVDKYLLHKITQFRYGIAFEYKELHSKLQLT